MDNGHCLITVSIFCITTRQVLCLLAVSLLGYDGNQDIGFQRLCSSEQLSCGKLASVPIQINSECIRRTFLCRRACLTAVLTLCSNHRSGVSYPSTNLPYILLA